MGNSSKTYHVGTLVYTRATLAVLFCWLFWGDICYTLMETVVPSILPVTLKNLDASNLAMGIILASIPLSAASLCNPVISFKSDRFRSKWGRRIPFIILSLPLLVMALLGVGTAANFGVWLHRHVGVFTAGLSASQFSIALIAIMMVFFSVLNMFVGSVFWYLFNDVVPEHFIARFMSWFRIISTLATAGFNWFLLKYAPSHAPAIFTGAAILYAVGFTLMCFNVKEGDYPPPPEYAGGGKRGAVAAIKTYMKECFSTPLYNYIFLAWMCIVAGQVSGTYSLLFTLSLGLTLEQIGHIAAMGGGVMMVTIFISGWLADKYHPLRIALVGLAGFCFLFLPAMSIWIFFKPSPTASFYLIAFITIFLLNTTWACVSMMDPVVPLRLFPRERVGQFCSANAATRSAAGIVAAPVLGYALDLLATHVGKERAYAFIPVWQFVFHFLALLCVIQVYRHWKRFGGDDNYVARINGIDNATEETLAKLNQ